MVQALIPLVITLYVIIQLLSALNVTNWTVFGMNLTPFLGLAALMAVFSVVLYFLRASGL